MRVRRLGRFESQRKDVNNGIWRPSLDTYLPEQMDHVKAPEGYRIWHGASHLGTLLSYAS